MGIIDLSINYFKERFNYQISENELEYEIYSNIINSIVNSLDCETMDEVFIREKILDKIFSSYNIL